MILHLFDEGKSPSDLAREFNVSRPTISRVLKKHGRSGSRATPEWKISQCRDLYQSGEMMPHQISDHLEIDKQLVFKFVKDLEKKGCHRHKINHDFLSPIASKESAYFVGFFMADGYLYRPLNRMQVIVAQKDREILEKFLLWLDTDYE